MKKISEIKRVLSIAILLTFSTASFSVTTLHGKVAINDNLINAPITIIDSKGKTVNTVTDTKGQYLITIDNLTAPLLLSAMDQTPWEGVTSHDCLINDAPRAHCVNSILPTIAINTENTANINPLTDYIVSNIATTMGYPGPQQLIQDGQSKHTITTNMIDQSLAKFHNLFDLSLNQINIDANNYNPITNDHQSVNQILAVINHTRGYHNDSGEASGTILTDMHFRPIKIDEPLDYKRAVQEKQHILDAKTRLFIVSDSTAATYEIERLPRMGWGQVFQDYFIPDNSVVVLNGARAGRASRDFYNGGWYAQMAQYLKPGDVVFIAHGHNDQNCNSQKPIRGAADVKNLCTYPNDSLGNKQYPAGHPELSFQNSLERYVNLVKEKGAIPIIMTPTTRVRNAKNKIPFENGDTSPVVHNHFTVPKDGYLYTGDYSKTIKKTATDNQILFIDLEQLSIDFANQHPLDWKEYWLAIDQQDPRYPYYKTQTTGILQNPDTTHFQEKGARAIAEIIVKEIKKHPELKNLTDRLNNDE